LPQKDTLALFAIFDAVRDRKYGVHLVFYLLYYVASEKKRHDSVVTIYLVVRYFK